MTHSPKLNNNSASLSKYLSPLAVWALSFGCAVGWGSFVMPGTTFLPPAGPAGAVIGLFIGAGIMFLIAANYHFMIKQHPGPGGSYTFVNKALGSDHGFLCSWMLILTYSAIIWANSTALSLIVRYLFGDILCFGFSYKIAGYTIYFGEVLLSVSVVVLTCLICISGKKITKWFQIISATLLFCGISVCFIFVLVNKGGFSSLKPAFSQSGSPSAQIIGIVILAPWAFIGFESISHSSSEFKFSVKKSLPIMVAALITGALAYVMLTICAALAVPDGFSNWGDYLASLTTLEGIKGLPTFYAASKAMGSSGLLILGISAFCGITTGLVANYVALCRIIHALSKDDILPKSIGKISKKGIPSRAVIAVAVVSCIIPLFGRTAIGWIVDVTTIGATLVYAYISISAFVSGKAQKSKLYIFTGFLGAVFSIIFVVLYLLPGLWSKSRLASESYLILILWCVIGMIVFRIIVQRDTTRRFGKSEIVWIILFLIILIVSMVWINQVITEEATKFIQDFKDFSAKESQSVFPGLQSEKQIIGDSNDYILSNINDFKVRVLSNIIIQMLIIFASLSVIFSIYSVIKKREKQIESERLLAEESSKAKSTFLSNMSHDIRTPMNAITGYTALALKEDDISDNVRDYLEKIDISGKHLLSIINDILDMSRIESGKMSLNTAPADLCQIFDEAYDIFAMQMKAKNISFTVDSTGVRDRYVICDKNRINRILLNLLSNACKFTPNNGTVKATLLQTGKTGENASYQFIVEDTGIGMSPEFAERIFDAFERERNLTVNQIQGTGLGMSITKNFVELMGGTIDLKTEKGKGSKFTVSLTFKLADENEVEMLNPNKTEQISKHDFTGIKLLLAEDNPINSEIATTILSQKGFETDTAENGSIAYDMICNADEDEYKLILMDIQMPVMNGYDATRKIRALPGKKGRIPIIAMTANTFETDREDAFNAGMNAHVAKPFKPEELIDEIERQLFD